MARHHSLLTFLGRTKPDPETGKKGYRTANYQFSAENDPVTSANFGVALAKQLKESLDEVVILGTVGSDWSVLVENLAEVDKEDEFAARLDLLDAEQQGAVTQGMLDRVTRVMERGFGTRAVPRLIPVGETDDEQVKILEVIVGSVRDGHVSIDVTHGLRYLGMIGFVSAQMLERMRRRVQVRDIWYGALDLTSQQRTPVLRLKGLSHVQRWVDALGRFDATGDYSVFSDLLVEDGVQKDKARCLERAAFFERTLNLEDALKQLRKFRPILDNPLPGASGLFQDQLAERLRWTEDAELPEQQITLAREHLVRRDYLRAAIFALEAQITFKCRANGIRGNPAYEERKRARVELDAASEKQYLEHIETPYRFLKLIRNALAHGNPSSAGRYSPVLKDSDQLHDKLARAIGQIGG